MPLHNQHVCFVCVCVQHRGKCKTLGAILSTLPLLSPFPQLDTEYRKKWDSLVIKLEVVDRDATTGSEVVHWATHFPVSCSFLSYEGSVCVYIFQL